MSLSRTIEQANNAYDLKLTAEKVAQVRGKLTIAGFSDQSSVTDVLDAVLALSQPEQQMPQRYARLKQVTAAVDNRCPRCQNRMVTANLLSDRKARYCIACRIALPMKKAA